MANQYTDDKRVQDAVTRATRHCRSRHFSDLVDAEGNQYVDLVMEGGGVLGIALTGYTYVLEQAGIRFLGIAGTSAGSINALMIAALGTPAQAKSERLVQILADMPMDRFIDGDSDARDFSEALLEKARMIKMLFKAMQVIDNLKEDLGLNPGRVFLKWLTTTLEKEAGITNCAQLRARLSTPPKGLYFRGNVEEQLEEADRCGRLAMIAADVTTETKAEFPRMAGLYWADPDNVNPACFARASMSIPLFFHPFEVSDIPQNPEAWKELARYDGALPHKVRFVDGGIMSNFPINIWHKANQVPKAPTFGIKIGIDRSEPTPTDNPAQLIGAIFDCARHTLDQDFINQNPDYRNLVTMINTEEHNWLNFEMTEEDKIDLFARGAKSAAAFLERFDWEGYKEIRYNLAQAVIQNLNGVGQYQGTVVPQDQPPQN